MLSGYAARDHRVMVIKQRRPDQGSRISPSGTAVTGLMTTFIRFYRFTSGEVRNRGKMEVPPVLF